MIDIKDRFLSKVNKTGNCWLWTAGIRSKGTGYGCFKMGGRVVDAHRVSYMLFVGKISKGKYICHTCDNRLCVNPKHLFTGTSSDNMKDASNKGRLFRIDKRKSIPGEYAHCSVCQKDLQENLFSKNKNRYNGLNSQCKDCVSRYMKDYDIRRGHTKSNIAL